jgi:hypothetical protein
VEALIKLFMSVPHRTTIDRRLKKLLPVIEAQMTTLRQQRSVVRRKSGGTKRLPSPFTSILTKVDTGEAFVS